MGNWSILWRIIKPIWIRSEDRNEINTHSQASTEIIKLQQNLFAGSEIIRIPIVIKTRSLKNVCVRLFGQFQRAWEIYYINRMFNIVWSTRNHFSVNMKCLIDYTTTFKPRPNYYKYSKLMFWKLKNGSQSRMVVVDFGLLIGESENIFLVDIFTSMFKLVSR